MPTNIKGSYLGATEADQINNLLVGLLVVALAVPRGPKQERYGLWEPYVR